MKSLLTIVQAGLFISMAIINGVILLDGSIPVEVAVGSCFLLVSCSFGAVSTVIYHVKELIRESKKA